MKIEILNAHICDPLNAIDRVAALYIADTKGWTFHVTSIAGSSHIRTSRHYSGIAFDVNRINGVKVGAGKAYYREFMNICRARGATEVLGPGDRAHSTHVHAAWPRS